MKTKDELPVCPVATAVSLVGGKWKLLIIRNLRMRPWRFNELQRDLEGISQKVLTDSLRQMMDDGLVYRHDYQEMPPRVDYSLTELGEKLLPITGEIAENIYNTAYKNHSLMNECERGVDDTTRVWWVQAEAVVGFLNAWQKKPEETKYLDAAKDIWGYIKEYVIDKREGSEWFWCVNADGSPIHEPIVEPWKCPYHNGRMCMEVIRRLK